MVNISLLIGPGSADNLLCQVNEVAYFSFPLNGASTAENSCNIQRAREYVKMYTRDY